MEFFRFLMDSIENGCEVKKVGDRPLSVKVDDSLITEVKYDGEIYRIFVQKDEGKAVRAGA